MQFLAIYTKTCKLRCGPFKIRTRWKSCEVKGGGQEMAVMVARLMAKNLIFTIQVNVLPPAPISPELSLLDF